MTETPHSISDWSVDVFPTLTKEAQEEKLTEEILEYIKAKTDEEKVKELADIYIVSSILKCRFNCDIGFNTFRCLSMTHKKGVYKEVCRKMEVNRSRKWEWNGKTYKHVKGTGE